MLHSYIINRSDTSSELRVQAARRIYGLRCRVVHATEGEAGDELLLPFSPEAHQLARDIELVSFVANKALLSTATKFLA